MLVTAVDELAQGLADSSMALRGLERRSRTGLLAFEDYDFASWLVGSVGQDDLAAKADALLAPLLEQPQLFETLVAYLRASEVGREALLAWTEVALLALELSDPETATEAQRLAGR